MLFCVINGDSFLLNKEVWFRTNFPPPPPLSLSLSLRYSSLCISCKSVSCVSHPFHPQS